MENDISFRRLACLYLDAYCASHVQAQALSEAQVTDARVLFHQVLSALDAPVLLTPGQPSHKRRHALCDLANLKLFVERFARAYLGTGSKRKRR